MQPKHHDTQYSVEKAAHDMFETIDPGLHYDEHKVHHESYQQPVHHYHSENPHHWEGPADTPSYEEDYNEIQEEDEANEEYDWFHQEPVHEYHDHDMHYLQ